MEIILKQLQYLWVAWNLRGFMILSLTTQLLLAIISPVRKRTSNPIIIMVTWLAYFVADWAAIFAFGLITCTTCTASNNKVSRGLYTLWSAFLLIHLDGPDSMTTLPLGDDAMRVRQLVGKIARVLAFLNNFTHTFPVNKFLWPTILLAVAGAIKYWQTSRSLHLTSIQVQKKSMGMSPSRDLIASGSDIKKAFSFFEIFKGLLVNIMPDYSQRDKSRQFFLHADIWEAHQIVMMELRFFYEVFHTKVLAANSRSGKILQSLAFYCILVALILFCRMDKTGIIPIDIRITYSLLVGALAAYLLRDLMLLSSSLLTLTFRESKLSLQIIIHGVPLLVSYFLAWTLPRWFQLQKEWPTSLGALRVLSRGFEEFRPHKGFKNKTRFVWCKINGKIYDKIGVVFPLALPYQRTNKFQMKLLELIFQYLCRKASDADSRDRVREIYEARGEGPLFLADFTRVRRYVKEFDYDESILIWHCATEILYWVVEHLDEKKKKQREFSKVLSDYMAYLLIRQTKLMSPVVGIAEIRYRDTVNKAKHIGGEPPSDNMETFCKHIVADHGRTTESDHARDKSKSVLFDACDLAKALKTDGGTDWDTMSQVWVELLSYGASHIPPESHVRLLSEGRELITIVWLLMAHLGIGSHFPTK